MTSKTVKMSGCLSRYSLDAKLGSTLLLYILDTAFIIDGSIAALTQIAVFRITLCNKRVRTPDTSPVRLLFSLVSCFVLFFGCTYGSFGVLVLQMCTACLFQIAKTKQGQRSKDSPPTPFGLL